MTKRNNTIDYLKFFCILGVVYMHTPINWGGSDFANGSFILASIITIARVCVPLFFISSGYFFYDRCSKEYTKKYTNNLLKTFIIWSVIFICFNITELVLRNIFNSRSIFYGLKEYFSLFKLNDLYYCMGIIKYHLWYLVALIIVIPILYLLINKKILKIGLVIALLLNILGVMIPVFIDSTVALKMRDAFFFGLFYCTLGAYIKKNENKIKLVLERIPNIIYFIIIVVLFGVSIIEDYVYQMKFGVRVDYFLTTIPLSSLLFLICITTNIKLKDSVISKIGRNTLGIYLIHPMIVTILSLGVFQNIFIEVFSLFGVEWLLNTMIWHVTYVFIVLVISYNIYEFINI